MNRSRILFLLFFALSATYLIIREPAHLPIGLANGTYVNACCESLVLKDGRMSTREWSTSYVIQSDKGGAYILPQHFVGVIPSQGLVLRSNGYPLMLRLDDTLPPKKIEIWEDDSPVTFSFERQN